jgi:PST family polysaccharide transporter
LKPFSHAAGVRTQEGEDALGYTAVRAAGVTIFSQGVVFVVQLVGTVILGRVLEPRDFGLVTMVTTFSLALTSFGLNGFTEAVLQRENLDNTLASNLFWVNVGAGLLLTAAFAAAGGLLARFYGDAEVRHVAIGMSATIILSSLSVMHLSLLKRAMQFGVVSLNDVVSKVVSVAVSIVLAVYGWKADALVAGAILQALCMSIGAWVLCRWVPRLPRRTAGTGSMVGFALNVYSRYLINYFTRNMDNLLVGWRFSAKVLGAYKKAYDLFLLSTSQILSPVAAVVIATLSQLIKDLPRYRRYFLSGLSMLAFVGMGLSVELTLVGKDVIRVMLGPGWEMAGQIFTYFGPGVGIMLLYNTHGWLHLSAGRADRWFRWGLVEVGVTAALFLLALPWGAGAMAVAWTVSYWVLTFPAFQYAGSPVELSAMQVVRATWRYVAAALAAGALTVWIEDDLHALAQGAGVGDAMERIVVTSLFCGVLYLGAVVLFHGGLAPLAQFIRIARHGAPWKSNSSRSDSALAKQF